MDLPLAFLILAAGFAVGYGVREMISRKRHRLSQRRHYPTEL
jgi:hypothetical protein